MEKIKGVILCFFTFWILVCVVCIFGHKKIYKVTTLKVHSKGRYFVLKKIPFQELQRTARLDYKVVQMVGWWGECLVEHVTFQNQNPVRVFLYHCISDGNQPFSENFGCHFHLILHVMSDKAAFVSGAVLCTVLPGKPRPPPLQQRLPLAEN